MFISSGKICAEEADATSQWFITFEPKLMHAETAAEIPGAQKTVYVPVLAHGNEPLVALSKKEFAALNVTWEDFLVAAKENATAALKELKPEFTRNKKRVIEYATLSSEKPYLASTVLSPKFLELFAETLGPKLLVAIPNQNTVYVFPALASHYQDYAPMILDAYKETTHPCSVEVFEVSSAGIRAAGVYERP